jgi:hypothetical protein
MNFSKPKSNLLNTFLCSAFFSICTIQGVEYVNNPSITNVNPSVQSIADSIIIIIDADGHKICTSQIKLPSGEIAYFGFEPIINEERSRFWRYYTNFTTDFCNERGLFTVFFRKYRHVSDSEELKKSTEQLCEPYFNSNSSYKKEICNLLKKIEKDKYPMMTEAMYGIASGCIGFHDSYSSTNYVGYISKKPITGFFSFPITHPEYPDYPAYMDAYDNLIMVISSFCSKEDRLEFEHRGIFRNPTSMLRKDYRGVGVLLHSFCAYARSIAFPEVEIMRVNPDANDKMRDLLIAQFPDVEIRERYYFITVKSLREAFQRAFIKSIEK